MADAWREKIANQIETKKQWQMLGEKRLLIKLKPT